nr:MAG TPA: hypothetical protein [Caudoviricetes sp.]
MRVWRILEGHEGAGLVRVAGDGDVSACRVELDPLALPFSFEAALRGCCAPDV